MNIEEYKEKFIELAKEMSQDFGAPPKRIRIGDCFYQPVENGLCLRYEVEIEF
jgi:hypothetical protein